MKRWSIGIITCAIILGGILVLTRTVQDPADFTGKWYYAFDCSTYLFHNGIILNEKYHLSTNEDEIFSGAYSFSKNKILIFFVTVDGIEQIKELQLVSHANGDMLCEVTNDRQEAVFYRNKDTVKTIHG